MLDKGKLERDLTQHLKDLLGQSNNEQIIGWSIRDCLDNPTTGGTMQVLLDLREEIEKDERKGG